MMNMKKIEELTGFRNPNDQEKDRISRYFQNVFQKNIKTCQTASAVLCVVGVLCMTSYDSMGIMSIIIGLLAFAAAFSAIWTKKGNQQKIEIFKNGRFQVLEGKVMESSMHPDYPGVFNIRFQSWKGENAVGWYRVRQEELQIGTPLLLVYVDKSVINREICRTFTPYMLSDEGLNYCF